MNQRIENIVEKIIDLDFSKKAEVGLVVCHSVSVVREVTSKEYFQIVDVDKIANASNELRKRAGLIMSRNFNMLGN